MHLLLPLILSSKDVNMKTLGEMLRSRYVKDFVEEMAKLGKTRKEVIASAVNILNTTVFTEIDPEEMAKFEAVTTVEAFVESHIGDILNEVYN